MDPLASEISQLSWWHHIRLGPYVTPGRTDLDHQNWITANLPQSFSGARVLDVGAWDGYFSFLAEERGASEVVSIDNLQNREEHRDALKAFDLARRVKQSRVNYMVLDVLDVGKLGQKFDIALFLGVYYHLRDPIAALSAIHDVLGESGVMYLEGLARHGSNPLLYFYNADELEETTYCGATIPGLKKMCEAAGFSRTELVAATRGSRLGAALSSKLPLRLRTHLTVARKTIGVKSVIPRVIICARR